MLVTSFLYTSPKKYEVDNLPGKDVLPLEAPGQNSHDHTRDPNDPDHDGVARDPAGTLP